MTDEERLLWRERMNSRPDLIPGLVDFHTSRIHLYCCHTHSDEPTELNGQKYFLFCGRAKGHEGIHEDLHGGVWWHD